MLQQNVRGGSGGAGKGAGYGFEKQPQRSVPVFIRLLQRDGRKAESVSFAVQESGKGTSPRGHSVSDCRRFQGAARLRDCGILYDAATKCGDMSARGEFDRAEFRTFIPFVELSCCYFYLGDKKKALMFHEKAKSLRPSHPSVLFNERFFGAQ